MADNRILAIDIGATSVKVGEFEYPASGGVDLVGFAFREYEEELTENSRSIVIAGLLRQMIAENEFEATKALVSISGKSVFVRFVKLPSASEDENQIKKIVEFEAQQKVPFAMDEVIWDYQLVANPETSELTVMLVVLKNEIVEELTRAIQSVGLETLLVDIAPAACYNAARANHVGDDECSMILNIGGKSINLLFADKQRFFSRTLPFAGSSITQQIGKEFGIGLAEAEELKRRHGFVALGGAYAEPESEVAVAVSKIIRNVMARLHTEINRSISVYRSQHKGNRPVKLYLTGGSSTMMYTDHFFAEKLRMEVAYLNPFQVVNLDSSLDVGKLEEVAHMFSEVVGLGLRYKVRCPVEISLIPETIRNDRILKRKKPYFYAAVASMLLLLGVVLLSIRKNCTNLEQSIEKYKEKITTYSRTRDEINASIAEVETNMSTLEQLKKLFDGRKVHLSILNKIYEATPKGVWLYDFKYKYGDFSIAEETEEDADSTDLGVGGMPGGDMPGMGGDMSGMGGDMSEMGGGDMSEMGGINGSGDLEVLADATINGVVLSGHSVVAYDSVEKYKQIARELKLPENSTLEVIFKKQLENTDLFEIVKIEEYIEPRIIPNLSSFVIIAKFKNEYSFKKAKGSAIGGNSTGSYDSGGSNLGTGSFPSSSGFDGEGGSMGGMSGGL